MEEAEELLGSPPLAMDFLLIHHIFHGKPIGFNVVVFLNHQQPTVKTVITQQKWKCSG